MLIVEYHLALQNTILMYANNIMIHNWDLPGQRNLSSVTQNQHQNWHISSKGIIKFFSNNFYLSLLFSLYVPSLVFLWTRWLIERYKYIFFISSTITVIPPISRCSISGHASYMDIRSWLYYVYIQFYLSVSGYKVLTWLAGPDYKFKKIGWSTSQPLLICTDNSS